MYQDKVLLYLGCGKPRRMGALGMRKGRQGGEYVGNKL